ncbi:hypothetical protein [Phormidesmis sp. 146-33]
MSDYTITHGHLDDRHFQSEFDDWLDSLPAPPETFTPTCGQCKHYEARKGRAGFCGAKLEREWCGGDVYRNLHPERDMFDEACDRYVEEVPF